MNSVINSALCTEIRDHTPLLSQSPCSNSSQNCGLNLKTRLDFRPWDGVCEVSRLDRPQNPPTTTESLKVSQSNQDKHWRKGIYATDSPGVLTRQRMALKQKALFIIHNVFAKSSWAKPNGMPINYIVTQIPSEIRNFLTLPKTIHSSFTHSPRTQLSQQRNCEYGKYTRIMGNKYELSFSHQSFDALYHLHEWTSQKRNHLARDFSSAKMFHMLIKGSVRGLTFKDEVLIRPLWFLPLTETGLDFKKLYLNVNKKLF